MNVCETSPPPRLGDTPSLEHHFEGESAGLKPFGGTGIPKKHLYERRGQIGGGSGAPTALGIVLPGGPTLTRWAKLWHASGVSDSRSEEHTSELRHASIS